MERSIPRADVADIILAVLDVGAMVHNRPIDIVSRVRCSCSDGDLAGDGGEQPQQQVAQQSDWHAFFAQPGN